MTPLPPTLPPCPPVPRTPNLWRDSLTDERTNRSTDDITDDDVEPVARFESFRALSTQTPYGEV